VVLLSLFAICLAGATVLEAHYGAAVARDLVYRTWWFALLLVLLAVNVVGAALKKYPWKRQQTGFLITHAGLLLLLFGGLMTALGGVEGQMVLIDSPNPEIQARFGIADRADTIFLADAHRLEVYRLKGMPTPHDRDFIRLVRAIDRGADVPAEGRRYLDGTWEWSFNPGPLPWHADGHPQQTLPWQLQLLHRLACPCPGFTLDLGSRATLTVDDFYPHVEASPDSPEPFVPRAVRPGAEPPGGLQPALRCQLRAAGRAEEFWVGLSRGATPVKFGDDVYLVRYRPDTRALDFTVTLKRARQVKDPGTDRAAWFQSDVCVTTQGESRDHCIYMNHPLDHGRLKVYQANYRALFDPMTRAPVLDGDRPVSLSGLIVADDPGLWAKYAGALTVVLGIATMFYMKAYFFRRRATAADREKQHV
jgi:hypothetical protein